jgi:dihydrofolate synthase/folylpolyglutamate synthase
MCDEGGSGLPSRLAELYRRRTFGIKPGLDAIAEVLDALGNPQQACGVIHVAGTNGKGSVSSMVASLLSHLGLRVGLYTSPHLVAFGERIQVDGVPVAERELADALDVVLAAERTCGRELTFFEVATAMAWVVFREGGVSLAVVETGLGGRLDATNVVLPLVSVVTRIGLDHSQWLGDDLVAIAREKGGIIKAGRPVVLAPQEEEVAAALGGIASELGCRLVEAAACVGVTLRHSDLSGQDVTISTSSADYGRVHLPLLGEWQLENASVAVSTVEVVCDMLGVELDAAQVRAGLGEVRWPGRMELVRESPCVLFDAAHNPLAAQALVRSLKRLGVREVCWIVGMCEDKDVRGVLRELSHLDGALVAVPISDERGMAPEALVAAARSLGHDASVATCVSEALDRSVSAGAGQGTDFAVVVCGSIFLLEAGYRWLGRDPYATPVE